MGRQIFAWVIVAAVAGGACGGGVQSRNSPPQVTVGARGALAAGLLTETQLRQVPGLATAKVAPLEQLTAFEDPDPRGPCGGRVPVIPLQDVAAISVTADTIRGAAQLVARLPAGAAKRYLDARQADTAEGCPEYEHVTPQDVRQKVVLVRIVRLHREFDQALAVVSGIKVGENVRAATHIEVRTGDILSRVVVSSDRPLGNNAVRGIASIVGRNLSMFEE